MYLIPCCRKMQRTTAAFSNGLRYSVSKLVGTSSHCCFSSLSLLWLGSTIPPTITTLTSFWSLLFPANQDTKPVKFFTLSRRAIENRIGFFSCTVSTFIMDFAPASSLHHLQIAFVWWPLQKGIGKSTPDTGHTSTWAGEYLQICDRSDVNSQHAA